MVSVYAIGIKTYCKIPIRRAIEWNSSMDRRKPVDGGWYLKPPAFSPKRRGGCARITLSSGPETPRTPETVGFCRSARGF